MIVTHKDKHGGKLPYYVEISDGGRLRARNVGMESYYGPFRTWKDAMSEGEKQEREMNLRLSALDMAKREEDSR